MKGMKKILYNTALIVTLAFILPGCAKCISTETSTVQVKVINKYYTPEYSISRYDLNLETIVINRNPAVYRIDVEYNGAEFSFYGQPTYKKYSNRVGEYVNATIQIKKYDNDTAKYKITGLE